MLIIANLRPDIIEVHFASSHLTIQEINATSSAALLLNKQILRTQSHKTNHPPEFSFWSNIAAMLLDEDPATVSFLFPTQTWQRNLTAAPSLSIILLEIST